MARPAHRSAHGSGILAMAPRSGRSLRDRGIRMSTTGCPMNLHITDSDVLVPASLRTCFRVVPHAPASASTGSSELLPAPGWQEAHVGVGTAPLESLHAEHPLSSTRADAPGVVITPGLQDGHGPVQAVQAPARLREGAALGPLAVEPPGDGARRGTSDGCGPCDVSPDIAVQFGKPQELPGRRPPPAASIARMDSSCASSVMGANRSSRPSEERELTARLFSRSPSASCAKTRHCLHVSAQLPATRPPAIP